MSPHKVFIQKPFATIPICFMKAYYSNETSLLKTHFTQHPLSKRKLLLWVDERIIDEYTSPNGAFAHKKPKGLQ